MTVEIEGVTLHLAHPDELAVEWVGQDELMRQLLAAWAARQVGLAEVPVIVLAYTYFRNEALNANSFFNNTKDVQRPRYRYVTGGVSVGGPLFIPKKFNSSKTKVFFFFNDEYSYQGNPGGLTEVTMPTARERTGDFSQTLTVGGALVPIYQPGTKIQYPGNMVPQNLINPWAGGLEY